MLYAEFLEYKAAKNAEVTAKMKLPMEENKEENNLISDEFIYDNREGFVRFVQMLNDEKIDRPLAIELYEMQKALIRLETESACSK
jgi:hypothetical protein